MNMKKRFNSIIAIVLTICMLSAFFTGCSKSDTKNTANPLLNYTLTKQDLADYQAFAEQSENFMFGDDYNEKQAAEFIDKLWGDYQNMVYQAGIAEILFSCDMKDEQAEKRYMEASGIKNSAYDMYITLLTKLYNSEERDFKALFKDWGKEDLNDLVIPSQEYIDKRERNIEIQTDFRALSIEERETILGERYSEYVQNGNFMAEELGYSDYYDYMSKEEYWRSYDRTEREQYRLHLKKYMVPIYINAAHRFDTAYADLSSEELKAFEQIVEGDYNDISSKVLPDDYMDGYFDTLRNGTARAMKDMFERKAFVDVEGRNAESAAFTIEIGAGAQAPFCYFGPEMKTAFTVIHELGHYYSSLADGLYEYDLDLSEIHSQGNEMMFAAYLENNFKGKVSKAVALYQVELYAWTALEGALMDEFEEKVYKDKTLEKAETEYFDKIMAEVVRTYGFGEHEEFVLDNMMWRWRNDCIENPVYYLSYSIAGVGALSLYGMCLEDYQEATEAYRMLVEEAGESHTLEIILSRAGLGSPFDKKTYIKLSGALPGPKQVTKVNGGLS